MKRICNLPLLPDLVRPIFYGLSSAGLMTKWKLPEAVIWDAISSTGPFQFQRAR
jgi:hypothetical protein